MPKEIINVTIERPNTNVPWGFVIIGGKDQSLTVKVGKVKPYSPAENAGLKALDYIYTINGTEIFEMTHAQVVELIKKSGNSLTLSTERYLFLDFFLLLRVIKHFCKNFFRSFYIIKWKRSQGFERSNFWFKRSKISVVFFSQLQNWTKFFFLIFCNFFQLLIFCFFTTNKTLLQNHFFLFYNIKWSRNQGFKRSILGSKRSKISDFFLNLKIEWIFFLIFCFFTSNETLLRNLFPLFCITKRKRNKGFKRSIFFTKRSQNSASLKLKFNFKRLGKLLSNFATLLNCRGDHIVPNFEEIWPSKKGTKAKPKRGLEYYWDAMQNGPELSGKYFNDLNFRHP